MSASTSRRGSRTSGTGDAQFESVKDYKRACDGMFEYGYDPIANCRRSLLLLMEYDTVVNKTPCYRQSFIWRELIERSFAYAERGVECFRKRETHRDVFFAGRTDYGHEYYIIEAILGVLHLYSALKQVTCLSVSNDDSIDGLAKIDIAHMHPVQLEIHLKAAKQLETCMVECKTSRQKLLSLRDSTPYLQPDRLGELFKSLELAITGTEDDVRRKANNIRHIRDEFMKYVENLSDEDEEVMLVSKLSQLEGTIQRTERLLDGRLKEDPATYPPAHTILTKLKKDKRANDAFDFIATIAEKHDVYGRFYDKKWDSEAQSLISHLDDEYEQAFSASHALVVKAIAEIANHRRSSVESSTVQWNRFDDRLIARMEEFVQSRTDYLTFINRSLCICDKLFDACDWKKYFNTRRRENETMLMLLGDMLNHAIMTWESR